MDLFRYGLDYVPLRVTLGSRNFNRRGRKLARPAPSDALFHFGKKRIRIPKANRLHFNTSANPFENSVSSK